MRPSRFDYIMLLLLLLLMAVMAISSCTAPRHTVHTDDDLAGCPMLFERSYVLSDDITFDEPYIITSIHRRPISDTLLAPPCEHYYVHQATPGRDSTYTIDHKISLDDLLWREPTTVKVEARRPCICIYCHHLNICF